MKALKMASRMLKVSSELTVTGATDDGLLEGTVRGSGASGLFPSQCVQEVRLRQNANLHQVRHLRLS